MDGPCYHMASKIVEESVISMSISPFTAPNYTSENKNRFSFVSPKSKQVERTQTVLNCHISKGCL